jgi:hypothetical protein
MSFLRAALRDKIIVSVAVQVSYPELWAFLLHPFISASILFCYPQFGISCSKLRRILTVFKMFILNDCSNFGRRQFLRYKLTPFIPFTPTSSLLFHVSRCSNCHFTKPGNIKLFDLMFWCELKLLNQCTVLIITIWCHETLWHSLLFYWKTC